MTLTSIWMKWFANSIYLWGCCCHCCCCVLISSVRFWGKRDVSLLTFKWCGDETKNKHKNKKRKSDVSFVHSAATTKFICISTNRDKSGFVWIFYLLYQCKSDLVTIEIANGLFEFLQKRCYWWLFCEIFNIFRWKLSIVMEHNKKNKLHVICLIMKS